MQLAWWDWPIEKITENVNAIATGNLETLKNL
jgi:virginiamycin A acetyltransferase